jgi:hypothetical protein
VGKKVGICGEKSGKKVGIRGKKKWEFVEKPWGFLKTVRICGGKKWRFIKTVGIYKNCGDLEN